ncbi:uncharacterized protein LOC124163822 [Ischnura elegans]|uniref:uncharacterized protein LOC124163822 n=1 Tax=Ischnura elegans TaxID=197161 RepID=UPI001ED86880|nr:uncharacterized protein LOC124163822 [Ischnura elegans]
MWRKLEKLYTKSGPINQTLLLRELISIKKEEDERMEDYFAKFFNLNRRLKSSKANFDDKIIARFIIGGLPIEKYEELITTIDQGENIDLEEVMARLMAEEARRESHKSLSKNNEDAGDVTALASRLDRSINFGSRRGWSNDLRGGRMNYFGVEDDKNANFNERRFWNNDLRGGRMNYFRGKDDKNANFNERRFVCFACKEPGHIARECPYFEERKTFHKKDRKYLSPKRVARSADMESYSSSSNVSESEFEEERQQKRKGTVKKASMKTISAKAFIASIGTSIKTSPLVKEHELEETSRQLKESESKAEVWRSELQSHAEQLNDLLEELKRSEEDLARERGDREALERALEAERCRSEKLLVRLQSEVERREEMELRVATVRQERELVARHKRERKEEVEYEAKQGSEALKAAQTELDLRRTELEEMSKKVHELEARLEDQQAHHPSIFELEAQLTEKNKSIRVLKQRLGDRKKTLQRELRYTGGQSFDGSGNISEGESLAGGNSTFPLAPVFDIGAEGGKMEKSWWSS